MASLAEPTIEAPKEEPMLTPPGQPKTEEELSVEETTAEKKARRRKEKKKRQAANKRKKKEKEAVLGETKESAKGTSAVATKASPRENDPLTVLLLSEHHGSNKCSEVQVDRMIECIGRVLYYGDAKLLPKREKDKLNTKGTSQIAPGPARIKRLLETINTPGGSQEWLKKAKDFLKKTVRFMGEMRGTITQDLYDLRHLSTEKAVKVAKQQKKGTHTCFVQFMHGFPNIFDSTTLEAGGAELDKTSSPLQKLIFCTLMISGRLIYSPPEPGENPNGFQGVLYASDFFHKGMCLCFDGGEQCPEWDDMNPESINHPAYLSQVMANLQRRIETQMTLPSGIQLDRVFDVYDDGELLGRKSFNEAFQELVTSMTSYWRYALLPSSLSQPGNPATRAEMQRLYQEYYRLSQVLFNLCVVEARNITWIKKIESVALNNPEVLLLIVPCGANHFEGMIRDILTNPNLRISNLSQSYVDITKSTGSMDKQAAQAKDVFLTDKAKQKLTDQNALPATEHISRANDNHGQGRLAPGYRSQEPETPGRPYTYIGGKKKTRKKRKTKKGRRKSRRKKRTKKKHRRKTKRKRRVKRRRRTRRR